MAALINLLHEITSRRPYKSTLHFLSFSNIPHIYLTIIRSIQTLQIRFLYRPGVSPISQYTLDTSLVYSSLYAVWCIDAPRAVRIEDNSLNLAQAHLTLALAASSTPPSAPSLSPKKQNLGTHSNFTVGLNHNLFQQNWPKEAILSLQAPPAIYFIIFICLFWFRHQVHTSRHMVHS